MLDNVSSSSVSVEWSLSQSQYNNLISYINKFESTNPYWSLSVNCTDFATGAARSVGIHIPSVNTGPFQDPNRLGNWLNKF